jgi:hypothetical protein
MSGSVRLFSLKPFILHIRNKPVSTEARQQPRLWNVELIVTFA